jgi:hypothetical protein
MSQSLNDSELLTKVGEILSSYKSEFVDGYGPIFTDDFSTEIQLYDVWQQTFLRRAYDLGEWANNTFAQHRLVPGCTLTRSIYETVALYYYSFNKIVEFTESNDLQGTHKTLMASIFGSRDGSSKEQAVNVLTTMKALDKEFNGANGEYDHLCEYAHPNLKGGFGTYVNQDISSFKIDLGFNPQNLEMGTFGLGGLHLILLVGGIVHDRVSDHRQNFLEMVNKFSSELPS